MGAAAAQKGEAVARHWLGVGMGTAGRQALAIGRLSLPACTRKTLNLHIWAPAFTGFGGGIGAFSRALASGVNDLGHEVHLFGKLDTPGSWNGFPLSGCGNSTLMRTPRFAALCLASCARRKPDHVISTHLNFGPVAHLAKRVVGTPFTLVAYGIDVHSDLPRMTLSALRAADRVVAVSAWTRRRVLALGGVDPEKVCVLPPTLDETQFTVGPKSQSLISRYRIAPDERVVLTVARLESRARHKGYDRVVEALPAILAACGKVRLILVGNGDDFARVQAIARRLGVDDVVTLAGFVADDELADHYRLADVFAMPSTGDGFGIVYIEAMACGTPVLAGDRDGSADALDGGALGRMVDPGDVRAVAEGVISLLRKEGPPNWFDKMVVRDAVIRRFGRGAFRESLRKMLFPLDGQPR
jgi:phosphatidyl-myo-inositol dimannoside synthase